ncbi:MAG: Hsp20/alpha crystallin family protein [Methyloprofundus sp.]|nr:Hsp20/alpha crystallin family protein [Methyloprofundus sp.]MDT8425388.1 Hsp20/alpha crystallin family protein [Methyloprofundus sp.]
MINRQFNILLAAVIVVFGIQAYMIRGMHNKLDKITEQKPQVASAPTYIPPLDKLIKPAPTPAPSLDDKLFNDPAWNPYKEMQRMQRQMDQIFGDSFSRFHSYAATDDFIKEPDVNLQEKSGNYIVTVNAPGADESTLNVKIEGQKLHISIKSEHSKDVADDKEGYYQYHERFKGEYQRILGLPGPVNANKMTTEYENGVLTITVPKK